MNDLERFIKLLNSFSDGMLVTHSSNGELHARPMAKAAADPKGDVWLLTGAGSEKVYEVEHDARACVTMHEGRTWLSVNGTCRTLRDPERIKQMWQEPWRVWFPKGPTDPEIVLLHIRTTHGEFWDNSGTQAIRFAYEAAKAYLSGDRMQSQGAQQAKVNLPT
jgi:general stress protein 26